MSELLWSDPQPQPGRTPSKRGIGFAFGPDISERFLKKNGLTMMIRSHEVKPDGYELHHNQTVATVFSAPNYCDQIGNRGAFVRFTAPEMKPTFVSFPQTPHPAVPPMAYAPAMSLFGL
jgi:serine/threonine-protein phosphatase 5